MCRLLNKVNQIHNLLIDYNIDILCLCETWLRSDVTDIELQINGYHLYRCDRTSRRGGGVAIYARMADKFKFEELDINCVLDYETIVLKASPCNAKPFIICSIYRPPNSRSESDQNFLTFVKQFTEELILGGDVNIDYNTSKTNEWFKTMDDLGLKQLIQSPTRIVNNSKNSIIDHIYTNSDKYIHNYGTIEFEISNHKPVFICRKLRKNSYLRNQYKIIKFRDFKNFDKNCFESSSNLLFAEITEDKIDIIDKRYQ